MPEKIDELLDFLVNQLAKEYTLPELKLPQQQTKEVKRNSLLETVLALTSTEPEIKYPVVSGGQVVGLGLEGTATLLQNLREIYKSKVEERARKQQLDLLRKQMELENEYRKQQLDLERSKLQWEYTQIMLQRDIANANLQINRMNALTNIVNSLTTSNIAKQKLELDKQQFDFEKTKFYENLKLEKEAHEFEKLKYAEELERRKAEDELNKKLKELEIKDKELKIKLLEKLFENKENNDVNKLVGLYTTLSGETPQSNTTLKDLAQKNKQPTNSPEAELTSNIIDTITKVDVNPTKEDLEKMLGFKLTDDAYKTLNNAISYYKSGTEKHDDLYLLLLNAIQNKGELDLGIE